MFYVTVTVLLLYLWTVSSFNSVTIQLKVNAKCNQRYTGGSEFVDCCFWVLLEFNELIVCATTVPFYFSLWTTPATS